MRTILSLNCAACGKPITKPLGQVHRYKQSFCNLKCMGVYVTQAAPQPCGQCGQPVTRVLSELRSSKSGHLFCNNSCSAIYSNTHKTVGTRRSKLEVWLEAQLRDLYPNLTLLPNDKTAINSELDLYFPDLRLAFELNGIFHYEPIYGPEKLASIQNNDHRKFAACIERGISLCILDSSKMTYFKESKAKVFLDIIRRIIQPEFVAPG